MKTIHIETELPTDADRVWKAMQHPAAFTYVVRGLIGFPALNGRTEPLRVGEEGTGWMFLFHVIPLSRHTIYVADVDEATRTIRTHEHGGMIRTWNHTLHVEPTGDATCRYSDTIEMDAGSATALLAASARGIYRYRQRRWHKLVRKHLLPTGTAYGGPSAA